MLASRTGLDTSEDSMEVVAEKIAELVDNLIRRLNTAQRRALLWWVINSRLLAAIAAKPLEQHSY